MNRKQRREAERNAAKEAADFKMSGIGQRIAQKAAARQAVIERLSQQGISPADLKAEYEKGYKKGRSEMTSFQMRMFYCACGLALHEQLKFGETRIIRILDRIHEIMTEEISAVDIGERLMRETGIEIFDTDYDS